jgi:hypothetical protein
MVQDFFRMRKASSGGQPNFPGSDARRPVQGFAVGRGATLLGAAETDLGLDLDQRRLVLFRLALAMALSMLTSRCRRPRG